MIWRRKTGFVLVVLKFFSASVNAVQQEGDFSLFFSEQELKELLSGQEIAAPSLKKEMKLYLGALFYQSPQDWTIWMNDRKITSTQPHPSVCVREISPHTVTLEWVHEDHTHKITLKPNQSYDPLTKEIREGKS